MQILFRDMKECLRYDNKTDNKTTLNKICHRNGPIYVLCKEKTNLQLQRVGQFLPQTGHRGKCSTNDKWKR